MRLLVIRLSAMGDAAMVAPVLRGMRQSHPDAEIILLTRKAFGPFFRGTEGVELFFPDLKGKHYGFAGLYRLFRDINKKGKISHVIDLHDVLRSRILRAFFRMAGVRNTVIDKGRKGKKAVIEGRSRQQLKHTVERYRDVFERAGFPFEIPEGPWIIPTGELSEAVMPRRGEEGRLNIGIAPFARHKLKSWPVKNMITLMERIGEKYRVTFWLFGGRDEIPGLEAIAARVGDSELVAGGFSPGEEIALISRLDLMISMDSANMHLAALTGTKVVSIWGATSPLTGFGPWKQPAEYEAGIPFPELDCRPCSVFGKGECRRGDLACLAWLSPEKVFKRVEAALK